MINKLVIVYLFFIVQIFAYLSDGVSSLQAATQEGAEFVFGYLSNSSNSPFEASGAGNSMIFAFQILPLIIVISSLSALLWFWNILPLIIRAVSKVFEKLFNIGGPIGLGATANIIMGQVEAPLLVRPYLSRMSEKELLILMTLFHNIARTLGINTFLILLNQSLLNYY